MISWQSSLFVVTKLIDKFASVSEVGASADFAYLNSLGYLLSAKKSTTIANLRKGILGLQDRYSKERLEAACALAGSLGEAAYNYPSLASILKNGRDQLHEANPVPPRILHENVRGGDYYAT